MRYLLVALLAILTMAGCHKEDPEQKPFMKAAIQGIPFSALGDQVRLLHDGAQSYISASTGEATIRLDLAEMGTGTTSLSLGHATVERGGFTSYSVSGTLNITSLTPYVVGSFAFTCNDGTSVSGGSFLVYNE